MIFLTYDALCGVPYRDGEVVQYTDAIINAQTFTGVDLHITCATANLILALRVAIKDGILPLDGVSLQYRDYRVDHHGILRPLRIDSNGRIDQPHPGFCDTTDGYVEELARYD